MRVGFESYGRYASDNYGAHTLRFTTPDGASFWFSYRTLVAFKVPGGSLVVRENDWGPTTGKHLNWIDRGDKSSRVDAETFGRLYRETFADKEEG